MASLTDPDLSYIASVEIGQMLTKDVPSIRANIYAYRWRSTILYIGASVDATTRSKFHLTSEALTGSRLLFDVVQANRPASNRWKIDFYEFLGSDLAAKERGLIESLHPICNRVPRYQRPRWPARLKYPNTSEWRGTGWYEIRETGAIWRVSEKGLR